MHKILYKDTINFLNYQIYFSYISQTGNFCILIYKFFISIHIFFSFFAFFLEFLCIFLNITNVVYYCILKPVYFCFFSMLDKPIIYVFKTLNKVYEFIYFTKIALFLHMF